MKVHLLAANPGEGEWPFNCEDSESFVLVCTYYFLTIRILRGKSMDEYCHEGPLYLHSAEH